MSLSLLIVLFLVLVAEFVNGWNDAPNAIATVVSTRVLRPVNALIMAAILNIFGAVLTGTAVAATIGSGIVKSDAIGLPVIAAAVLAVATWGAIATSRGLPISISHGLVSGMAGAALAVAGSQALLWEGWQKILIGLGFSTLLGFFFAYILMTVLYWILRKVSPSTIRNIFSRLQIVSAAFMAFSHGSNDGQKFMGVFALALVLGGAMPEFSVPLWVILLCGTVMGLGTAIGGWRVIKTLGCRLTKLEPVHGFVAETAAASAIQIASFMGVPLSTTHTISTAIMGVGATRRLSAVRWGVAGNIVATWGLTFPLCGILGALFALVFNWIF
ncbi:MAG: inorganic phosphate transporter [Dehalococcoidales bacterium]|nr:inorganic phosphate transporter [Dehalococcoidales bacterium]